MSSHHFIVTSQAGEKAVEVGETVTEVSDGSEISEVSEKTRHVEGTVTEVTEVTGDLEKTRQVEETVTEITVPSPSADPNQGASRSGHGSVPTNDWPAEPTTLIPDASTSILAILFDAALIVAPLLLLAKIALVLYAWHIGQVHKNDLVDYTNVLAQRLIELNGQLITLFTIVFVTIVSTAVRRYALYKAQKGAYVSELEQLQGSTSLPSTLKLIWSLRAFSTMSLALIGVWSFYYLGSQSSKLEFTYADSAKYNYSIVAVQDRYVPSYFEAARFANATADFFDEGYWTVDNVNNQFVFVNEIWGSVSGWTLGEDPWNNPTTPDFTAILRSYENGFDYIPDPKPNREGWVTISPSAVIAQGAYVSLIGTTMYSQFNTITTSRLHVGQAVGTYSFTDSYFDLTCADPVIHPFSAFPQATAEFQSVSINMTNVTNPAKDLQGFPQSSLDVWWRWTDQTWPFVTNGSSCTTCSIARVSLDIKAECSVSGCIARQIRWANGGSKESATTYDTPFNQEGFDNEAFFSNLLLSYGPQDSIDNLGDIANRFVNSTQQYIIAHDLVPVKAGADILLGTEDNGDPSNYTRWTTQEDTFDINTYFDASTSWILDDNVSIDWDAVADKGFDGLFDRAIFHGNVYNPQYVITWPWLVLDLMSCTILLAASIISVYLRRITLAPDILGSVSSLTRDNPYIDLPHNGSTLDGLGRARLLKQVKVKLGDVGHYEGQVGRVAMVRVDHGLQQVNPLGRTTRYI